MEDRRLHPAAAPDSSQGADGTIRVLAAVIRDGSRYLVCLRPAHKRHGGRWEFPGGKLEPGETLFDAARRELNEELGVEVLAVGRLLETGQDPESPFVIEFTEVSISGVPQALEHDEVRWVTTEDLLALNLAPSDRRFSEVLVCTP